MAEGVEEGKGGGRSAGEEAIFKKRSRRHTTYSRFLLTQRRT